MDRYVYSSVQEESSAAILYLHKYIISIAQAAFVPSCKTAPVERPCDAAAIRLLLCKEHSSVSVLTCSRCEGRQLIFGLLPCCMYVWSHILYSNKSMDQPGKVPNPARGQLNRENEYSPVRVRA